MRRLLSKLALVPALLAVVVLGAGAGTSVASPAAGADIYGVGAGKRAGPLPGTTQFDLSAHQGANGRPDFGHVAARNPDDLNIYVDVDCVNVFGLTGNGGAWIAGVVRRVSPVPNFLGVTAGDRQTFFVEDGGRPSAGTVDGFYFDIGEQLTCDLLPPATFPPNVTKGNIRISIG